MPSQKSKIESPHQKDHFTVSHTQTLIDCGGTKIHTTYTDPRLTGGDEPYPTISRCLTPEAGRLFSDEKEKSPEGRRLTTKNLNRKHSHHKKPTRETLIAPPPLSSLAPRARTPSASYAADISSSNPYRYYIHFIRYQSFSLMSKQINDPVVCAGNRRKSHQMKTQEPRQQPVPSARATN